MSDAVFLPGSVIGILGGGQLGRMSAQAAAAMGYQVCVYEPGDAVAGDVCVEHVRAGYEDMEALEEFAKKIDVCTLEFENVPTVALERIAQHVPMRPMATVLGICQNREQEKLFLRESGFACADFRIVNNAQELAEAVEEIGRPAVLKSAFFGYDGKGQVKIEKDTDLEFAWEKMGAPKAVLEAFVNFKGECSVIVGRNGKGACESFPCLENIHKNHILHMSILPGRFSQKVQECAKQLAEEIAQKIGLIGVLGVEFFVTEEDEVLVNELAPRPHNSGHATIEACVTSQFEQHIRAITNMPLGSTEIVKPTVMVNILGDSWRQGAAPDWGNLLEEKDVKLHLYGKKEARIGRKMGHFCVVGEDMGVLVGKAEEVFDRFCCRVY